MQGNVILGTKRQLWDCFGSSHLGLDWTGLVGWCSVTGIAIKKNIFHHSNLSHREWNGIQLLVPTVDSGMGSINETHKRNKIPLLVIIEKNMCWWLNMWRMPSDDCIRYDTALSHHSNDGLFTLNLLWILYLIKFWRMCRNKVLLLIGRSLLFQKANTWDELCSMTQRVCARIIFCPSLTDASINNKFTLRNQLSLFFWYAFTMCLSESAIGRSIMESMK